MPRLACVKVFRQVMSLHMAIGTVVVFALGLDVIATEGCIAVNGDSTELEVSRAVASELAGRALPV